MNRLWFALIGISLIVSAFARLWPTSLWLNVVGFLLMVSTLVYLSPANIHAARARPFNTGFFGLFGFGISHMHRFWLGTIAFLLIVSGFAALWPASLYVAQPFNTNLFFGFFGAILLGVVVVHKGS